MPRQGGYREAGKPRKRVQSEAKPQKDTPAQKARKQVWEDQRDDDKKGTKKPGSQNKRK